MANVINQPDGTSVSVNAPVSSASVWEVVYEVDFTAEDTSSSLDDDDTIEIGGVTWTAKNGKDSVYCSEFKIINGTGLQIQFGGGTTDTISRETTTVHTNPRIETLISNIVSGLSYKDTIAIQLQTTPVSLSDDWQGYGVTITNNASSTTKWIANRILRDSTGYSAFTGPYDIGNDVELGDGSRWKLSRAGLQTDPAFKEVVWSPASAGFAMGADVTATAQWQEPLTCSQMQIYGTVNYDDEMDPAASPALNITAADATIQLNAWYNDQSNPRTGPAWNATFTKLRVLKVRSS